MLIEQSNSISTELNWKHFDSIMCFTFSAPHSTLILGVAFYSFETNEFPTIKQQKILSLDMEALLLFAFFCIVYFCDIFL